MGEGGGSGSAQPWAATERIIHRPHATLQKAVVSELSHCGVGAGGEGGGGVF